MSKLVTVEARPRRPSHDVFHMVASYAVMDTSEDGKPFLYALCVTAATAEHIQAKYGGEIWEVKQT